jgi:hypothetical protein
VPGTDPADRETLANLQPPREVPGTDFPLAPISPGRLLAFGDPCRSAWHRFRAPISQAFFDVDGMLECKRI